MLCMLIGLSACKFNKDAVPKDYLCSGCNVILISIDTLRADHLGIYGNEANVSPALDRFAEQGIIFETAYSQAPVTAPSHMSMMTSLYPSEHKVCYRGLDHTACRHSLNDSIRTLAEMLKSNGYLTVAQTGNANVGASLGFYKGFDYYNEFLFFENLSQGFLSFSDQIRNQRFFLFLHTYKVHYPYFPSNNTRTKLCPDYGGFVVSSWHELKEELIGHLQENPNSSLSRGIYTHLKTEEEGKPADHGNDLFDGNFSTDKIDQLIIFLRNYNESNIGYWHSEIRQSLSFVSDDFTKKDLDYLKCLYDGEILEMDDSFNDLLSRLRDMNLLNNTILIFTSDHGEEFQEHGGFLHYYLYNEIIHIPLVIWNPRIAEPMRIGVPVRSIDILPTILDMVGIDMPPEIRGRSLIPVIWGSDEEEPVISEEFTVGLQSVIYKDYKLMKDKNSSQLYHLGTDQEEKINIMAEHPEMADELNRMLEAAIPPNKPEQKTNETIVDARTLQNLRALGYI
ncbi:MAG: sulfatase [archaeon]